MRDLVLRHSHAAWKHGSFTSSTIILARSRCENPFHLQHRARYISGQSASNTSSPSPRPGRQSQRRTTQSNALAPLSSQPSPQIRIGQGPEPTIDADTLHAVKGLVQDLASTRPPPLTLPEAPHPYSWPRKGNWNPTRWDFKYLLALGKAYGKFYWTGIKQAYGNFKLMHQINRELHGTFPDAAARYGAVPERISYNDYELMVRAKRDMKKSIPFLLVFAICGEFTPLVIVALGSRVVPGTCVIPKQELQDRKKTLERDAIFMQEVASLLRKSGGSFEKMQTDRRKLITLHNLIAYRAGLTPFKSPPPLFGRLYWHFRTQKLLARHCDEILSAATLVQREGGWSKKSPQDMWEWGNKYGLYRLRQYTRKAMARNEDPVSDRMKTALLPHFEAETRSMLSEDWSNIRRTSHCTAALNSPLYDRPDINLRRRDIESIAGTKN